MADGDVRGPGPTASGGWVPIPDPTTLTTEAVTRATEVFRREILALRETLETRLAGVEQQRSLIWTELHSVPDRIRDALEANRREILGDLGGTQALVEQRLDSMDKAIELAAGELARIRDLLRGEWESRVEAEREFVMAQVEILRSVAAERFAAIDGRFTAAASAVAAQNAANDRAITVAQAGVKEQLESLGSVTDAGMKALESKITDARDRITAIESLTRGIKEAGGEIRETRAEQRLSQGAVVSLIVAGIVALSLAVSVIALILRK